MSAATMRGEKLVDAISSNPHVTSSSKKYLMQYINFMRAKGLTDRTIAKNLYCLSNFLQTVPDLDISKIGKDRMTKAIADIERSKYAPKTKQNIKASIKSFYKHIIGNDEFYPENVRWIKTSLQQNKKVIPEEILNEDDIGKLLNASNDIRDKAIIALLYDSGVRIGELLSMKIKDVDMESEPAHITVTGKTGMRRIPIMFSAPYLAAYLNLRKDANTNEPLWSARGSWSNLKVPIDRSGVAKVLLLAAKKAGITKRINPHSFRHARATYYANRLTEQQLKHFFGWTNDSRMASVYVHLSGRDIDNAVLEANGQKSIDNQEGPKLKILICDRCKFGNTIDAMYCTRCGAPLTAKNIFVASGTERDIKSMLMESIKDPKLLEEIVHQYLLEKKKGGNR